MKKVKVLFVCMGNICRSPLAAAIFKDKILKKGMTSWVEVDSCGTSNYHTGDNADSRTRSNASKNGIEIAHCVRQLMADDLEKFDIIVAMDNSNLQNILRMMGVRDFKHKVKMMREFDSVGKGGEVPDPYFGNEKGFQEVFEILDRSMNNFIGYLHEQFNNGKG